jgi:hypothetical protein
MAISPLPGSCRRLRASRAELQQTPARTVV